MPDVALVSIADLATARDKAYANAAAAGISSAMADAWDTRGDRLEVRRQKLAAAVIDTGSEVYTNSLGVLNDAKTKLAAVNATLTALASDLQAFDDLIKVLTKIVATVLPLIA